MPVFRDGFCPGVLPYEREGTMAKLADANAKIDKQVAEEAVAKLNKKIDQVRVICYHLLSSYLLLIYSYF